VKIGAFVDLCSRERRAAEEMRDEFITVASHELKTPLTALELNVASVRRRLREGEAPIANERTHVRLERASRQLTRMTRLIDELLDASRVSVRGLELTKRRADLGEIAHEVGARLSDELALAGCALAIHAEEVVVGDWDRARLEQALTYLLLNAVKYGAGKPIEVCVSARGRSAALSVRDQGIGIRLEKQARIWRRFERCASASQYGGLGIGLYLARRIVEEHGGTIEVTSLPGEGATFLIELPRGEAP
jgi:signal transduction histidine kinase